LRERNNIISSAGRDYAPRARLGFRTPAHSLEQRSTTAPSKTNRYAVELFRNEGMRLAIEAVLGQESNLKTALVLYNLMFAHYSGRLIMLRAGARVLARSDRPETMAASR
jgi:hypothetical protein